MHHKQHLPLALLAGIFEKRLQCELTKVVEHGVVGGKKLSCGNGKHNHLALSHQLHCIALLLQVACLVELIVGNEVGVLPNLWLVDVIFKRQVEDIHLSDLFFLLAATLE